MNNQSFNTTAKSVCKAFDYMQRQMNEYKKDCFTSLSMHRSKG